MDGDGKSFKRKIYETGPKLFVGLALVGFFLFVCL